MATRSLSFSSCGNARSIVSPSGYLLVQLYDQGVDGAEYIRMSDETRFLIVKDGDYVVKAGVTLPKGPPVMDVQLTLEVYDGCVEPVSLVSTQVLEYSREDINFKGNFKAGYILRIRTKVVGNPGNINIHGSIVYTDNLALLNALTAYDFLAKCQWIPARPAGLPEPLFPPQYPTPTTVYPWTANVIPWKRNQGVPGSSDNAQQKFKSVPVTIGFFMGLNMLTMKPNDPRLSVFLTNFEDRGPNNERKRIYMSAFTQDVLHQYDEKIQTFVNNFRSTITTYAQPVLSGFQESMLRQLFLPCHIGYDEYPDYVITYFKDFLNIIGNGDPSRPGRNEEMLFGNQNVDKVKAYFHQRLQIILETGDESSFTYWWSKFGLDAEGNVMEAIHNIIAFSQFINTIYNMIKAFYGPGIGPANLIKYNFFDKFKNAPTQADKLDVLREIFRLTAPNSIAFSNVDDGTSTVIKSRFVNQAVMITNSGGVPQYIQYDTTKYAAFHTDFTSGSTCPAPSVSAVPKFDISTVDSETVLDKCNPKVQPVFASPIYCPFGLGYRRCAGEEWVMYVFLPLIEALVDLVFYFDPTITVPSVPLAPFVVVPDNVFVVQPYSS